jgi:hypothetical protein
VWLALPFTALISAAVAVVITIARRRFPSTFPADVFND